MKRCPGDQQKHGSTWSEHSRATSVSTRAHYCGWFNVLTEGLHSDRLRTGFTRLRCHSLFLSKTHCVAGARNRNDKHGSTGTIIKLGVMRTEHCLSVVNSTFPLAHENYEFASLLRHKNILRVESSSMGFQLLDVCYHDVSYPDFRPHTSHIQRGCAGTFYCQTGGDLSDLSR